MELLQNLISDLRKAKASFVPRLSEQNIASVWENVSDFIEKQMVCRKGVSIQGLGIFSFAVKTIDIGNNRRISLQRPVFLLSEKFSGTHCIQYPKQHTPGQIPVVALNYTILSNDSPFDRDTVEMCVKEILQALSHAVSSGRMVDFPFLGIGKLIICDGKAKMKFFREFIRQLDCSGQMEGAFLQRSSTSMGGLRSEASIISNPATPFSRPDTTGSLVLPRIVKPSNGNSLDLMSNGSGSNSPVLGLRKPAMPPISEHTELNNTDEPLQDNECKVMKKSPQDSGNTDSLVLGSPSPSYGAPLVRQSANIIRGPQSRDTLTTSDESVRSYLLSEGSERATLRPPTCSHPMNPGQEQCYICHQRAMRNIPVSYAEERRQMELEEDKLLQEYLQKKDMFEIAKEQISKVKHREHSKKVAAFNLSVADSKSIKKNAKDEEFHPSYVFQQRSVTPPLGIKQTKYCSQLDQQVNSKLVHHKAVKKQEEDKDRLEKILVAKELELDHQEYIRRKNKQKEEYRQALAEQVKIRNEMNALLNDNFTHASTTVGSSPKGRGAASPGRAKAETSSVSWSSSQRQHHLRPLSLPKPTIIIPFSHTKPMLIEDADKMKTVRFKNTPLPPCEGGAVQPIFGVHDMTPEKLQEHRQRARNLFKDQLEMVKQKQYLNGIKAQRSKDEELDMLKRARQDLIEEYRAKQGHHSDTRRSLDEAWKQNIAKKLERESEERKHAEEPSIRLLQQCDKYKRCGQCKRSLDNKGGSNVLAESRYISGARLIV